MKLPWILSIKLTAFWATKAISLKDEARSSVIGETKNPLMNGAKTSPTKKPNSKACNAGTKATTAC